jgi:hypothetical protein
MKLSQMLTIAAGVCVLVPGALAQTSVPGKVEPAKTDPAKTEPAKTEPAKTEPSKTELTKTEPAKTEPSKASGPSSGTAAATQVAAAATKISAGQLGVSYESYSSGIPQRDTIARMMRTMSVDLTDQRLEDVAKFIQESTSADIEFLWGDGFSGLDKEKTITMKVTNRTALQLLDAVLERAVADAGGTGATWQLTESGTLQVGTKESLNKFSRLEVYPISDLIAEVPDYPDAPIFDLQQAFQQNQGGRGGGGGGGSSFIRDQGGQEATQRRPADERAEELIDIIRTLVEPEQWDSGGATIRFWQNNLLIKAPDYIHRQINGYTWWPKQSTTISRSSGGRYVSLGVDAGISGLPEFQPLAITVPR